MADEACEIQDWICWSGAGDAASEAAQQAGGDVLTGMVEKTFTALGDFLQQTAFAWIDAPTPGLSTAGMPEESSSLPKDVVTLLEQVEWVGYAIAIGALLIVACRMFLAHRQGEGAVLTGKVFWILAGLGLVAGATGVVSRLLQGAEHAPEAGGSVGFVQVQLFPWMAGLAMLGVMVGGIKLMWSQRGEDGRAVLESLFRLVLVSAGCVTVTNVLLGAFDEFSISVLDSALECDLAGATAEEGGKCFGGALTTMVLGGSAATMANPATAAFGPLIALLVVIVVFVLVIAQFVLMIFRSAVIILMVGVLPTSSAFTNMATGRQWFQRISAWLLAALLYKPVAALIIAAGIRTVSTAPTGIEDVVWNMLTGGAILTLSVVALPALMKLMVPAVASAAGSSGGTMMGAMAGSAIANGAIDAVSAMSRSNSSSSRTQSSTHSSSRSEATGADQSGAGKAVPPSSPGPSGSGSAGASAGAGSSAGGGTAAAGAGSTAAAGAGAGSAAGPVGMAAGAAAATATKRVGEGIGQGIAEGANSALGDQNE